MEFFATSTFDMSSICYTVTGLAENQILYFKVFLDVLL